ncbi:hypothetical protein DRN52_03385 [Thermococci archaeon]|nr:MAG: hypothetical protein DRN52_03385 [Thermococci archaeon]
MRKTLIILLIAIALAGCVEEQEEGEILTPEAEHISPPSSNIIEGLSYVSLGFCLWKNWDRDPEPDGIQIEWISFYDEKNNLITFHNIPVIVEIKIYSQRWDDEKLDFVRNNLVYHGNVTITSSEDIIRIPKEDIAPDPSALDAMGEVWKWGEMDVAVHTPAQGTFYAETEIVQIYD